MVLSLECFKLVKAGKIYDLGGEFFVGMAHYPTHPPFTFKLLRPHSPRGNSLRSGAACIFSMGGHTGTHIDALGHTGYEGKVFGHNEPIMEFQDEEKGLGFGGIENCPPIIRRGIMLDIPALLGLSVLPGGFEIKGEHLDDALEMERIKVESGDVMLIRTGWHQYWLDPAMYGGPQEAPGLGDDASSWIAGKKVAYVGNDTTAFSVVKEGKPLGETHVILQYRHGIQIMEALDLEGLAKDGCYEFLFAALPLKIHGGTASPIRPVAVV